MSRTSLAGINQILDTVDRIAGGASESDALQQQIAREMSLIQEGLATPNLEHGRVNALGHLRTALVQLGGATSAGELLEAAEHVVEATRVWEQILAEDRRAQAAQPSPEFLKAVQEHLGQVQQLRNQLAMVMRFPIIPKGLRERLVSLDGRVAELQALLERAPRAPDPEAASREIQAVFQQVNQEAMLVIQAVQPPKRG